MNNPKEELDRFFSRLEAQAEEYLIWAKEPPKFLHINPSILLHLSRLEGFFEREELKSLVPAHAPIVRHVRLRPSTPDPIIIMLVHDYDEKLYHFES